MPKHHHRYGRLSLYSQNGSLSWGHGEPNKGPYCLLHVPVASAGPYKRPTPNPQPPLASSPLSPATASSLWPPTPTTPHADASASEASSEQRHLVFFGVSASCLRAWTPWGGPRVRAHPAFEYVDSFLCVRRFLSPITSYCSLVCYRAWNRREMSQGRNHVG